MAESSLMREHWNERALKNAFHYIRDDRKNWEAEAFFQSGDIDYQQFVVPVLTNLKLDPAAKTMLEIGSGVGRLTRTFARHFAKVYALDVSDEMLNQARQMHRDYQNIVWLHGNGTNFPQIVSHSMDFVFSYLVLQHLPTKSLVLGYIREALRVLKEGGVYCLHFCSCTANMNWKGHLIWGIMDRLTEPVMGANLKFLNRGLGSLFGLDSLWAGKTAHGAVVQPREALEAVWESGGAVCAVMGWGCASTWCYGYKVSTSVGELREMKA
jgi:SAM-dependent methyltransferase